MGSILLAFSMFSRIPVPMAEWNDKNRRYILAAFPLVGTAVGLFLWLWQWLCGLVGADRLLLAAGGCVIPLLVTGGIHMDGFADTVDARSSHAEPEKKRQILKDPHSGAFAITAVAGYMILQFAALAQLPNDWRWPLLLGMVHTLSRCCSGLCSLFFPGAGGGGLLSLFRASAEKRKSGVILILWAAGLMAASAWLLGLYVLFFAAACAGTALWLYRVQKKEFGGMSGDLSGYFLQLCELFLLLALVIWKGGAA